MTSDSIIMTLNFYKENKIKVHIKIIAGIDAGRFRNGTVLDVREDCFLIIDDVLGNKEYSFDEIDPQVVPYKKEAENGKA